MPLSNLNKLNGQFFQVDRLPLNLSHQVAKKSNFSKSEYKYFKVAHSLESVEPICETFNERKHQKKGLQRFSKVDF